MRVLSVGVASESDLVCLSAEAYAIRVRLALKVVSIVLLLMLRLVRAGCLLCSSGTCMSKVVLVGVRCAILALTC